MSQKYVNQHDPQERFSPAKERIKQLVNLHILLPKTIKGAVRINAPHQNQVVLRGMMLRTLVGPCMICISYLM
uniref:Zeta class glutathione S-transferase protein n=1 Tax=Rhizophora mucronata TaxID=61149 RepID=A0A2P2Q5K4_RHIMU